MTAVKSSKQVVVDCRGIPLTNNANQFSFCLKLTSDRRPYTWKFILEYPEAVKCQSFSEEESDECFSGYLSKDPNTEKVDNHILPVSIEVVSETRSERYVTVLANSEANLVIYIYTII